MDYVITHKQKVGYLTAFHFGGGWSIGEILPFSKRSWLVFHSERKVQEYIQKVIERCEAQKERWGDWTGIALKFAKGLSYIKRKTNA